MNINILLQDVAFLEMEKAMFNRGAELGNTAYNLVEDVKSPFMGICIVLIALSFAIEYFKGVVLERGNVNYNLLIKGLLFLVFIQQYYALMDIPLLALNGIAKIFQGRNAFLTYQDLRLFGTGSEGNLSDELIQAFKDFISLPTLIVSGFGRDIIMFIRALLLSLLYVVGPLAIVVSLIPGQEATANRWFISFIATHLWAVTVFILDELILKFNYSETGVAGYEYVASQTKDVSGGVFNLLLALSYFMVPYITGKFISGSTGGFMSKVVGGVTSLAVMATGGGALGYSKLANAGGSSGGGGSQKNGSNNNDDKQVSSNQGTTNNRSQNRPSREN